MWVLMTQLVCLAYKHQGDTKHKDMQSLVGVHIKNEIEEILDQNTVLYPFMLIFPNKRRIYYLQSKVKNSSLAVTLILIVILVIVE